MQPLNNSQKKKITQKLKGQFEIKNIPYLFLKFGKEKLRIYSGIFSKEELTLLDKNLRIENIGLYFAKEQQDGIRLTIDGTQIIKDQITKNIINLNKDQTNSWLKGNDLDIKSDKAFKILKYKKEFLGCGKSTTERITNFMPKERRIKQ